MSVLDEEFKITEKLIEALDELSDSIQTTAQNQKQALIEAGNEYINQAAETVIDYSIKTAKRIIINTALHFIGKLMRPPVR